MRELNLDQLRTLVTVVDLGTLSAAARVLHLAQPTVSLHLSELEKRMGTRLLLRGSGHARPTGAGEALIAFARRLLAEADDALQAVRRHREGVTGRVRLGASTGMLVHVLPAFLERARMYLPDVAIETFVAGTYDGLERIRAGTLDIGLVGRPDTVVDFVVTPWRRDPIMAFLPPGWKALRAATPAWLARQPLIANGPGTRLHKETVAWFAKAGIAPPRPRMELDANEAMKAVVAAGYGAAVLPVEGQAADHAVRGLQIVPLRPALMRETMLVHRALPLLDGATLRVLQLLRAKP
jgi:DNA-binding transcriptional LysR family regulator